MYLLTVVTTTKISQIVASQGVNYDEEPVDMHHISFHKFIDLMEYLFVNELLNSAEDIELGKIYHKRLCVYGCKLYARGPDYIDKYQYFYALEIKSDEHQDIKLSLCEE